MARLHHLLVRAARYEVGRRRSALAHVRGEELGDLATQAADDALMAVLAKRDQFRGESRFTTWAYKFALLEASVNARRRAWRDREVPLAPDAWEQVADRALAPEAAVEGKELIDAVREAITGRLTDHQRDVLVALAIDGVPVDVLAERLSTTRRCTRRFTTGAGSCALLSPTVASRPSASEPGRKATDHERA